MSVAQSPSTASRSGARRALVAGTLLGAEYLLLAVSFDGVAIGGRHEWWAAIGRVGSLVSISVAVFTAGLLVRGGELIARLKRATSELAPLELRWALGHALAFGVFWLFTRRLFGEATSSSAFWILATLFGWVIAGATAVATLLRFAFGSAMRAVAEIVLGVFAAGVALGLLAWFAGTHTLPLWDWLAGATLHTSALLLTPFARSVRVNGAENLLGIDDFDVTVAAACSGMENLGAVLVFLLGYFFAFREHLRFPKSLWLVPIALAAVWLVNSVRIAALVAIGAYWSPGIALGGFHSKAGWLALCLVALTVVATTQRGTRFAREESAATLADGRTTAYLLPLLTFLGVGLFTGLFAHVVDWLYPLSVFAAAAVAWRYRKEYEDIGFRGSWWALGVGVVAFALWVALAKRTPVATLAEHHDALHQAGIGLSTLWLGFRVLGAVAIVPFIEELAFRGYLQRRLLDHDFAKVSPARFGFVSLLVSAMAFGLLHESWLAGTVAGVAYSIATYRRGRLEDAVIAHATTNALLVSASLLFGKHELWH